MKTIQEEIGEKLRDMRINSNLSQERAGNKGGMDQKHISRAERGVIKNITVTTVDRIANIYGKKLKIDFE